MEFGNTKYRLKKWDPYISGACMLCMQQAPITDAVVSDKISGMLCVNNLNRPKNWLYEITVNKQM